MHVVRAGFAVTRGAPANIFGIPMRLRPGIFASSGYIFVVLGAALVALAVTSLAVLNSCRYMRIV
jgi:type IV secretory pathway VirB3-like protein